MRTIVITCKLHTILHQHFKRAAEDYYNFNLHSIRSEYMYMGTRVDRCIKRRHFFNTTVNKNN